MKLTGLSIGELRSLRDEVEREIKKREKEEVAKAREQIMAIAQSVGIPLKELIGGQLHTSAGCAREKGPARYRHPSDAALQWSGRGRQPQWVKDWLASGKVLDELRI